MASDAFLVVFLVAAGALVLFVVFRAFFTWYWKQSEQVALLKSIDASLKTLAARGQPGTAAPAIPASPAQPTGPAAWGAVPIAVTSVHP